MSNSIVLSTMWVAGMELGFPGLTAKAFTLGALSPATSVGLIWGREVGLSM